MSSDVDGGRGDEAEDRSGDEEVFLSLDQMTSCLHGTSPNVQVVSQVLTRVDVVKPWL